MLEINENKIHSHQRELLYKYRKLKINNMFQKLCLGFIFILTIDKLKTSSAVGIENCGSPIVDRVKNH